MNASRLSSLHVCNMNYLVQLRDAVRRDPVTSCLDYGIDAQSAQLYAEVNDEQLLQLAYSVNTSLFVPRFVGAELSNLLSTPAEIRGIIADANHYGGRHALQDARKLDLRSK